ncbi:hypothetical protein LELG_03760 [Lodderomyces elongisporus NRRL YB-4239]|uniref:Zn(2)-C6 fungal-type domain-containing protein n=1 Tax=Lodderomyces elongisporus (strain ATCC 11503 / CBS 2605 / JCM 1781 / NBRC 1676 / NRRL YB-4239) TaxID=379508 RepID=A5E2C3_LODEL|nr:hypothetical protein LELG_03760 [Lodderomyces elongisporus NRRL YB-4239]
MSDTPLPIDHGSLYAHHQQEENIPTYTQQQGLQQDEEPAQEQQQQQQQQNQIEQLETEEHDPSNKANYPNEILPTNYQPQLNLHNQFSRGVDQRSIKTTGSTITQDSTIALSPSEDNSSISTKPYSSSITYPLKKKRARIAKACQFCRLKKVKCDGGQPCLNCQQNNEGECVYANDTERKPRAPRAPSSTASSRVSKSRSMKELDGRLLNIEQLLTNLTKGLQGSNNNSSIKDIIPQQAALALSQLNQKSNNATTSYLRDIDEENEIDDGDYIYNKRIKNKKRNRNKNKNKNKKKNKDDNGIDREDNDDNDDDINDEDDDDDDNDDVDNEKDGEDDDDDDEEEEEDDDDDEEGEEGDENDFEGRERKGSRIPLQLNKFGYHSVINIFSEDSIRQLFRKLGHGRQSDIHSIVKMADIYSFYGLAFLDSASQPIQANLTNRTDLMDNTFPSITLPMEILTSFDEMYLASYVCDSTYIKKLFKDYFELNKQTPTKGPNSKLRPFTWSELMIMTVLVALSISAVIDERNNIKIRKTNLPIGESIQALSDEQLVELDSKCFFAMIYYYHRITWWGEGVASVQALLLFVMYCELVVSIMRFSSIPITIATRLALDLGLQRKECYEELSWHEKQTRKVVWWSCEYFEITNCFRNGLPPMLKSGDLTSFEESDRSVQTIMRSNIDLIRDLWKGPRSETYLNEMKEKKALHQCAAFFLHHLTKLRVEAYNQIFSNESRGKSFSTMIKVLGRINRNLSGLRDLAEPPITICFYDDDRFLFNKKNKPLEHILTVDSGYENLVAMYFNYYLLSMAINRVALQSIPNNKENKLLIEKSKEFKELSMQAARTILYVTKSFNLKTMLFSSFSWFLYYPFAALLHLASVWFEDPNSLDAERDISLMIETSLNFFAFRYKNKNSKIKRHCIRQTLFDLVSRFVLKVYLSVANDSVSDKFYKKYKNLRKHLNLVKEFPDFYSDGQELGINPQKASEFCHLWFRPYELINTNKSESGNTSTSSGGGNTSTSSGGGNVFTISGVGNTSSTSGGGNASSSSGVDGNAFTTRGNRNASSSSGSRNASTSSGGGTTSQSPNNNAAASKSLMERKIDSMLKHAISPLSSTQVRSQEYEDQLNDMAYQQQKQQIPQQYPHQSQEGERKRQYDQQQHQQQQQRKRLQRRQQREAHEQQHQQRHLQHLQQQQQQQDHHHHQQQQQQLYQQQQQQQQPQNQLNFNQQYLDSSIPQHVYSPGVAAATFGTNFQQSILQQQHQHPQNPQHLQHPHHLQHPQQQSQQHTPQMMPHVYNSRLSVGHPTPVSSSLSAAEAPSQQPPQQDYFPNFEHMFDDASNMGISELLDNYSAGTNTANTQSDGNTVRGGGTGTASSQEGNDGTTPKGSRSTNSGKSKTPSRRSRKSKR